MVKNSRSQESHEESWAPPLSTALYALLAIRIFSSVVNFSFITDVDEVMNYWEPTHFLVYGYGFQTWEYSPIYALRSYFYVGAHAFVAWITSLFTNDKTAVFLSVRFVIGVSCALCEFFFYSSVCKRFGNRIGLFTFLFLVFSPGMFFATTTFLPSTFSMYGLIVAYGAWFQGKYSIAVMAVALATILGWPFCIVLTFPLALDCIIRAGILKVIIAGIKSLILFMMPMVIVDYYFYHKILIAPLNIILYNVFSDKGPTLYGVEPWTFYFMNGFLNFNLVFVLAFVPFPVRPTKERTNIIEALAIRQLTNRQFLVLPWFYFSSFYIWFGLMSKMAHKEERFLFVIYHLICLNGAVGLSLIETFIKSIIGKFAPIGTRISILDKIVNFIIWTTLILFLLLSISRGTSMYKNYSAPVHLYSHLYENELEYGAKKIPFAGTVNICVGKEWYRFPSNFFLPSSRYQLAFVESGFKGQLPKPYETSKNATWIIPTDMNDENREEKSRYTEISRCHYFVDVEFPGQEEIEYSKLPNWETIYSLPFLDASRSHSLFRAFYIPFISEKYTTFNQYKLLRNKLFFKDNK